MDREHARILIAYLGRTATVDEETLELDTSDWRFKAGRQPAFTARGGMGAGRGAQRDRCRALPILRGATARIPRAQVLPLLARRSGARIELAGASAAQALRAHDGIGTNLRRPD